MIARPRNGKAAGQLRAAEPLTSIEEAQAWDLLRVYLWPLLRYRPIWKLETEEQLIRSIRELVGAEQGVRVGAWLIEPLGEPHLKACPEGVLVECLVGRRTVARRGVFTWTAIAAAYEFDEEPGD